VEFWFSELMVCLLQQRGLNFDELKSGGLQEESRNSNLEFGNHLSVCLNTEENLCQDDRFAEPSGYILNSLGFCFQPRTS
jgi:hypothetical protein